MWWPLIMMLCEYLLTCFYLFKLFLFPVSSAHVLTDTSTSFCEFLSLTKWTCSSRCWGLQGCAPLVCSNHTSVPWRRWILILVQQHISLEEYKTLHSSLHTQDYEKFCEKNALLFFSINVLKYILSFQGRSPGTETALSVS